MVRRKTLPQVSPKVANELRPLVTAIKEIIETGEGVRGDPLDRKLTLRDLVDSGIGKLRAGTSAGNPNALEPNPAPPNLSTPPAPTGFNAVGAFDGRINLTWDIPGTLYSNHAYTNVYRAEADNFANAILVGREAGSFYTDNVRDDVTIKPYYYWITFTSAGDIEGPLNATAGTQAQALYDPDYIIGQIQGLISKSELASEVLAPVDAIPGIQTTLSDHGARISSTEAALSDLLNIPAFDSTATYAVDDLVSYNGFTWRALVAMSDPVPTPTEGANWTQVGQYTTFSDVIAANSVAIDDLDIRITSNEGALTSYGTDITALQNRVTDTESGISGNSTAINTLDSRVTTAEGSISANSSDITLLQNSLTAAQGDITANSDALTLIDSRVTTAEGTISANSSDITQLQADVQALDVDGNAQALQDLDVRVTANEDSITAISSDVTTLTASVDGNTSALQTKAEVSAVQDLENDVTVLSAQYTVKLDVNGYVSGIGLSNDGTGSEFIVASDAVYFIDPGQSIEAFNPAANYASIDDVRDTQLVFGYAEVEGFKRFVINVPAYIPEGYITSGQVGAIGFGKITDSAGNPVTTVGGLLKADYIDVDNLSVAEAATFFGDAVSGTFSTGSAGWKLWQNGNFEAYNATVRGRIEADTGYVSQNLQIGGTSQDIGGLLALAESSDTSLFENWIRPGTTLINGNKIFTGDAYVDTLQIRGNAVTVPASGTRTSFLSLTQSWQTIASTSYNHGHSSTIPGIVQLTLNALSSSYNDQGTLVERDATIEFQLIINGSIAGGTHSQQLRGSSTASCVRFLEVSLPAGSYTIYLRAYYSSTEPGGTPSVRSAAFTVLGAKR